MHTGGRWTLVAYSIAALLALSACTKDKPETTIAQPPVVDVVDVGAVDETPCDRADKQVEEADLNGDGHSDVWRLHAGDVVTCKMTDLDYDGVADYAVAYSSTGKPLWEKFDLNSDKVFDRIHKYAPDGSHEVVRDADFDGTFDVTPDQAQTP